ncbi:DUF11 domain-containing protein [Streptomyces sp. SLBN-115]|uniref:DUF11 domain-containing protein n=1 Tax=Streptomyces sp. SLBN-115 TaxID=2768453 RepID=UPI001168078B|nr:DUF11 domain-containing protein [Streptomyces sp. SLBN-115]TQJ37677.1 putative repeat protein (TIGR01451 family) [Streptomyces sp. SLBN-115]
MAVHTLRRRVAALGTVLGLGIALPFATGATPAYAQAQLEITKTHVGEFTRGGLGTYRITVRNTGDEPTSAAGTGFLDTYPAGITVQEVHIVSYTTETADCSGPQPPDRLGTACTSSQMEPGDSYVVDEVVFVPSDQPCTVTNTVHVEDDGSNLTASASHTIDIPGPNCPNGGDGGNGGNGSGGSILPINLNGVIPMFNNITTNNNIHSPGATNASNQNFRLNTP